MSGRAKADRVYTGGCSQRGRRVGRLVINRPAAIGAIAVTSRLRRRAIRQGNDISAVLGDAAHRRLRELIRRVFKTRIQIRTAIRGKAPDCPHNSVVASRGGDILPVAFNACTSGKAHEGDIAANARGIALVAAKEIGRRSFCCRKTGLFSFDRIIGEPIVPVGLLIMLTTGCVVILLTTLGAVVHRAGGIEHQHGRGRAGRRGRGGLGGLDLQINPVGVVAERGRFLAQRDGVSVTGFILNRPGALLAPVSMSCLCRNCRKPRRCRFRFSAKTDAGSRLSARHMAMMSAKIRFFMCTPFPSKFCVFCALPAGSGSGRSPCSVSRISLRGAASRSQGCGSLPTAARVISTPPAAEFILPQITMYGNLSGGTFQ